MSILPQVYVIFLIIQLFPCLTITKYTHADKDKQFAPAPAHVLKQRQPVAGLKKSYHMRNTFEISEYYRREIFLRLIWVVQS